MTNGKGVEIITRNVTDGRTTDRIWYEINIHYFSNENVDITRVQSIVHHHKYPLYHEDYAPTKFEIAVSYGLGNVFYKKIQYLTFDLNLGSHTRFSSTLEHHGTYAAAEFRVDTCFEDACTRKYII